jgi:hypothetical protein
MILFVIVFLLMALTYYSNRQIMTKDILNIIEELGALFNQNGIPCSLKDDIKHIKKETGPKPILALLGTNGIFSNETCIFKTLTLELTTPVCDLSLQAFLEFEEKIEGILDVFLKNNENAGLKYSPKFDVLVDKCLYTCVFTLDIFSMQLSYNSAA